MTNVSEKFQEHEILLTGANGFLGKVVLGLLLDRYPEFKHLHILMRPTGELSAAERFEAQALRSPALAALRERAGERQGNGFRKITVWPGDVGRPNCGLKSSDLETLQGRVGLIINCAGLVDFFPPVDESFRSNVDGVEHIVALARQWGAKLLHISTCYVCGDVQGLVEETSAILGFYPHRKGPEDDRFHHEEEIRLCRERIRQIYDSTNGGAEHRAGASSRELTEQLVALGRERARNWGWVNTYTYAKSLGEQIIVAAQGLDYSIVRPAIVESSLRFPFPGWIEGGRTAAPLVLMALGGLKDWPVREDNPLEVVPVDLVASAILAAGALLLDGRAARVYQLGTADVNPIELGPLIHMLGAEARRTRNRRPNGRLGFLDMSRRIRIVTSEQAHARRERLRRRIERMQSLLGGVRSALEAAHLPGRGMISAWTTALRSFSLQTAFREQVLEQYLPFILHNRYIFESENIRTAYSLITEKDRKLLPWNPERIRWRDFWVHHQVEGIQKWIQPEAVREWAFKI